MAHATVGCTAAGRALIRSGDARAIPDGAAGDSVPLRIALLLAHLGQWVLRRLLLISLEPGDRHRCLLLVQGTWRHDPRERSEIPRADSVKERHGRCRRDVSSVPRARSRRGTAVDRTRTEVGALKSREIAQLSATLVSPAARRSARTPSRCLHQ